MPRFRYAFAVVLDDALQVERASGERVARARAVLETHERALADLADLARRCRAEVVRDGTVSASVYVEVGRRLRAIAAARIERHTHRALASRDVDDAQAALVRARTRRRALERHRDLVRARHVAAEEARAVAEFDETNLARDSRTLWNLPSLCD